MSNHYKLRKKVLAVSSSGGHWVQLLRLKKSFESSEVSFLTTNRDCQKEMTERVFIVKDAHLDEKVKLVIMFIQIFWIILKLRPDVIITTGAAPGYAALMFGKLLGSKTIWLDSIANYDELSKSGKKVKIWADVWLTQWEHLAAEDGPKYAGKIL